MGATPHQIGGCVLVVLLAWSIVSFTAYGAADVRAEKFLEVATRAQERALALRALALAGGEDVGAADALIAEGNVSLAAAEDAYEADPPDYGTSTSEATDAAASFRDALKVLGEVIGEEGLASEQAGQGLLEAIDNHRRRLQRLSETIEAIEDLGPSLIPAETQALLVEAGTELTAADGEFDAAEALLYATAPNVPAATQHITTGLGHLHDAFAAIRGVEDWADAWKAGNFLDPLLRQIERLQADIDQALGGGEDITAIQAKLELARELYANAEVSLLAGDRQRAVELFREIHKLLNEISKDLAKL